MNNRIYLGLAILLIAAGGFIYYQWSEVLQMKEHLAQDKQMPEENDERVAQHELPPADPGNKWVPHDDHFHQVPVDAPDVWQEEPVIVDGKVTPEIVDNPDWMYNLDREKFDGWDSKLVLEVGGKKIDLNYFRPMTEEEQAEYERLKATANLEAYGDNVEAEMRFIAIVNVQSELAQRRRDARGTLEHDKLMAEYDKLYGRFPISD